EFFTTTEILETPPVNQNNNSKKTDTQSNPNNTVSAENPTTDINLSLDGSFELIDIFMEEALELIEKGHEKISDTREIDTPFLTSIQRLLHTMKGSARMAGVTSIGDIAHMLESVFENVISKSIPLPTTLAQLTQETLDAISDMVEDAQAGTDLRIHKELISKLEKASRPEIADETIAETSDEINDRARDEAVTGFSETQPNELTEAYKQPDIKSPSVEIEIGDTKQREEILEAHIKPTKPRTTSDPIKVDATMLDQLVNFATEEGAIACRIADHVTGTKSSLFELDKAISRTLMQMRDLQFESNTSRSEHESTGTDNLNLSSFTESQKVAQRLMESIGDIENLHSSLTRLALETDNLVQQQKKIHNQLHENLLGTRMITFSVQTQRMQRILRQTCGELNKKAELILEGTDGSIDRTMLETAMGPLEHIIRNAIAHGIEQPKDRKKKHKPETGSVKVSFSRDKSEHLIIISDDGAGLDLKSIRKKALAKKLISANNKYSDEDIANLIFERGFTTSKEISQISGRGIGMDVVLNTIHELGGSVSISTKRNQGSTFTIRFPFTLSRNHTLIINAGKNTYALPSSSIEHSIPVSLTELENLYEAGLPKFKFNSQDYPLWYIDTLLNNSATRLPPASGHANVILIKFGQKRVALHVDSIADTRDTVLKPNSPQLSNVSGIAGATVLGDGKVILIIDVPSLTKLAEASVKKQRQFLPADEANKNSTTIKTMVVDDSITVRKVTERFLGRNGITALLAKDGLEALEVLEKETPDIILLDIEMPNMDGLELAEKIKSEARLHDVPIIMITSRTGKQHRHAASQIGVDVFLGKPYQESELLGYIQSLTGKRISR
ncbi:MAG: response regulator, partial [Gammaproteobacteria bacterium]|nr:response regulator [Gammaproteobacteria bacterium]